jgi:hypothetical protein
LGWKTIVPTTSLGSRSGRELDALELDPSADSQGFDQQGLGQARHPLEEDVAPGQERHEQALDYGVLADDGLANFIAEFLGPSGA